MEENAFNNFITRMRNEEQLVVQPRMGFGTIEQMQMGLKAVQGCNAPTIGTITIDSYTRVNKYKMAELALKNGCELNGFPMVTHGAKKTRQMLDSLDNAYFAVQMRHGTALPLKLFKSMLNSGIYATEGGPISYCLPYSRVLLSNAIEAWRESCKLLSAQQANGINCHLESFGGCMMGQLCPPSLLIALTVLECLFFKKYGLNSVSLSYAQGTNFDQDIAALKVIRKLAAEYLGKTEWHVVLYSFMGLFPKTVAGSFKILRDSALIASLSNCERLITKTPAESSRIPTVAENIASLEMAFDAAKEFKKNASFREIDNDEYEIIYKEAKFLIEMVRDLDSNLDNAFVLAFEKGYLDVPYCLHKDNCNLSRGYIDKKGYLKWENTGNIPFPTDYLIYDQIKNNSGSSNDFLQMLSYNQMRYDEVENHAK